MKTKLHPAFRDPRLSEVIKNGTLRFVCQAPPRDPRVAAEIEKIMNRPPKKRKPFMAGAERFIYTKDQCEKAYESLDRNEWNLVNVFDGLWREQLFKAKPHQAGTVLKLLEKIKACRVVEGRNFQRIWILMHKNANVGLR